MINLDVSTRNHFGKASRILRRQEILPGNIYSKKSGSVAIQLPQLTFQKAYEQAGHTSVIELHVDAGKKTHPVLISQIQYHVTSGRPIHVDFREINLKEKITIAIPIEFVGESQAVADGAMFIPLMEEIEVEALPQDMPESFQVDIAKLLAAGDELTIADLQIDSKKHHIELELETIIARAEISQMDEVVDEAQTAPVEVEIITEKSDSEAGESASADSE